VTPENKDAYKRRKRGLATVITVLAPLFIFDWIELFGRFCAPKAIGSFACLALPFTKLSLLVFPHHLADYAQSQCIATAQLSEPALSISFYMLKTAVTLTATAILSSWVLILPDQILPANVRAAKAAIIDKVISNIDKQGGRFGAFKKLGPVLFGLGLFCFYLRFTLETRPKYFKTDLLGKLDEDFNCLIMFTTLALLASYVVSIALFGLHRRRTPTY
jgi:hypothetical protein